MTAFIAGLLFGGVIGVVVTCCCVAAGRADQTQESDPRNPRDADKN